MALKSTVYKAELEIVDMDRDYYQTHQLTLACHPSESEERMMLRILAFALDAGERLEFPNLSDTEEPDLRRLGLSGELELWIDIGHPEEKRLARACGRCKEVKVYAYSNSPGLWWEPIAPRLSKFKNLRVRSVSPSSSKALAAMAGRKMSLQCSVQEGAVWFRDDEGREVEVELRDL
jgi:uncharacterized protein YaeQ